MDLDNSGLQKNVKELLGKFFTKLFIASDGREGYELYKHHHQRIIITDLKMPKMDGFEMIEKIKKIEPGVKVIIVSAYDEKEHLHKALDLGVFRYLSKPAKVPLLLQAILDAAMALNAEDEHMIFFSQIQYVFNFQNNIVMLFCKKEIKVVNKRFLEFFGVDNLEEFITRYQDMDKLLLEHKHFLYSTPDCSWLDEAKNKPGKLFHTKIEDHFHAMHHFILKLRNVPEKRQHYIMSFDDVTELNLMELYDDDAMREDKLSEEKKSILSLFNVIKENAAEVKIHNFYKGLPIVHKAVIINVSDEEVTLKTHSTQLKAVDVMKEMIVSSEIFPQHVIAKPMKSIDLEQQTITVEDIYFAHESECDREVIRLGPINKHSCTLFYKEVKISGETEIIDLSENSLKVKVNFLPAGIEEGQTVKATFVLYEDRTPMMFNTQANIYKIVERRSYFHLVLRFALSSNDNKKIKEYLGRRQMALIKEFKYLGFDYAI